MTTITKEQKEVIDSVLSIFDILKVNSADVKRIIGGNALEAYPNKLNNF